MKRPGFPIIGYLPLCLLVAEPGDLSDSLAVELGLKDRPVIVSGCHDQIAAAVGTGVYRKGMAVDGTGTVECITNVFESGDSSIKRENLYEGSYAVVPFLNSPQCGFCCFLYRRIPSEMVQG